LLLLLLEVFAGGLVGGGRSFGSVDVVVACIKVAVNGSDLLLL
jgi:hypothetical protein